jgi:hypothetical protein
VIFLWWVLRKIFGIEHPSHYIGGLTNLEVDEELERSEKESQAA